MKNLFIVPLFFLTACAALSTAPAKAQPCQWQYSIPANRALATYCGDAEVQGSETIDGNLTVIGTISGVFNQTTLAVQSIALMQAIVLPVANQSVYVQGYRAGSSLGGGNFVWNAASTATVDGITIFSGVPGTGRWLRVGFNNVVTPEMAGAYADNSHDDIVPINLATAWACTNKATLFLDQANYLIKSTWNLTYLVGCNNGAVIKGNGMNQTIVTYSAGTNNTGYARDTTGAAYMTFRDYSLHGGTNATSNDSPQVTEIQGGACTTATVPCTGSLIFSGLMTYTNVRTVNFQGTRVRVNAGAEQIDYFNCEDEAVGTSVVANTQYDVAGAVPLYPSAIVTTKSPVSSMTQIHWHGSNAVFLFAGSYGVLFHYPTTNGGAGWIHYDDFIGNLSTSGASIFMADDTVAGAGTSLTNVGGDHIQYESDGGNGDMTVANFGSIAQQQIHFQGGTGSGTTIAAAPFRVVAGATITTSDFDWLPNAGGAYTGGNLIVGGAGTLFNGITATAPLAKAAILSGGTQNSYIVQGTDGTLTH